MTDRIQTAQSIGDPLQATSREERDRILADRRRRAPVAAVDGGALYVATFAGVRKGLENVDHFVGSFGNAGDLPEEETVLPGIAEPRHGRIRKIINTVLAYHHAVKLDDFVRDTANARVRALIDASADAQSVDFCAHVARPLPSIVIAKVLGVPAEQVPRFAVWSDEILQRITEAGPSPRLGDLHPEFAAYVDSQIADRLGNDHAPGDLVSRMLVTDASGELLSPRAIRTQLINLIIAGNETTRNLIGNLFHRLAQQPELWQRLRSEPELRANAIEESLRIDAPVQFLARTCTKEIEIEGVRIKPGDRVLLGVASANFDEDIFASPSLFQLDRERPRDHAGFGFGPHLCPGAYLARMETRAVLDAGLDQIESLELDPSYEFDTNLVPFTYGPNTLSLRVRPA